MANLNTVSCATTIFVSPNDLSSLLSYTPNSYNCSNCKSKSLVACHIDVKALRTLRAAQGGRSSCAASFLSASYTFNNSRSCSVSALPSRSVSVVDMFVSPLILCYWTYINQAFCLQFKMRQYPIIHALDIEAQSLVCIRQVFGELMLEHNPLYLVPGFDLELDCNFVLDVVLAPDVKLKFVDGNILADDRFNRTWVDVCAPDHFHVIPTSPDSAAVKIPGAPA